MIASVQPTRTDMAAVSSPDDDGDALTSFELVLRAKAGDVAARDLLFAVYKTRLQRWAHGRLPPAARGAHETQDLVQDTLIQVLSHLHTFNPRHEGAFQGFVRTILANRIRDLARQRQRRGIADPLGDDDFAIGNPSPLDEAIGAQVRERYEAALGRLRPDDRDLIVAKIEMGLAYKDMVPMFQKPSEAAVTMAVRRALVRLAEEMAHARRA